MDSPSAPLDTANKPLEPAEPCPTPLSTLEVFESFENECTDWEIPNPKGAIRGQTLGDGPPLYFLHGLDGTSELFRLLAWLLKEDFRCVIFDAETVAQPRQTSTKDMSNIPDVPRLLAIADWLGDETFSVYGSGFGAWVALAGMIENGSRFQAAVLQGAYADRNLRFLERCFLLMGRRSNRLLKDVPGWQRVFEQNHRQWFPPFDAPRWEIFQQIVGNVPVRDLAHRARPLQTTSLRDRIAEISTPVFSIQTEGEGAQLRQRQAELTKSLPNCQSEWLQNSGLVPHWTHPHRIAKIIRQFLESHLSLRESSG